MSTKANTLLKKSLFSGIQPSGNLTLGNYMGAIKNWVNMQDEYRCYYAIVDLHAITVRQDPNLFKAQCYDCLALNIACGLDPDKSMLFLQSHVTAHTELAWILNCHAYMGELNRMTQFKEKSQQYKSNINVGLFSYPILQTADILLYNASIVPVGEDQKQHLELCRDIAIRFNNTYGDTFTIPEVYIPPTGARVMSLLEPSKKMSKSDENKNNMIGLLEPKDSIISKFKRAVTDSDNHIHYDIEKKQGVSNLLSIQSAILDESISSLENKYAGKGYSALKMETAEIVVDLLEPIQMQYQRLRSDINYLNDVLHKSALQASATAKQTLQRVYNKLGFIPSI